MDQVMVLMVLIEDLMDRLIDLMERETRRAKGQSRGGAEAARRRGTGFHQNNAATPTPRLRPCVGLDMHSIT